MRAVLSNAPPDQALSIARLLVEEGVAACVNLHPVQSIYTWKGELCEDKEVMMLIKVAEEGVARLRARLEELHPYEVMEFVVLEVDLEGSLPAYVDFVRRNTRQVK